MIGVWLVRWIDLGAKRRAYVARPAMVPVLLTSGMAAILRQHEEPARVLGAYLNANGAVVVEFEPLTLAPFDQLDEEEAADQFAHEIAGWQVLRSLSAIHDELKPVDYAPPFAALPETVDGLA